MAAKIHEQDGEQTERAEKKAEYTKQNVDRQSRQNDNQNTQIIIQNK